MNFFRHPKTKQEITINEGHELEGIKIRCNRKRPNLPTAWDDLMVAKREDRSWKNYRKTKHK